MMGRRAAALIVFLLAFASAILAVGQLPLGVGGRGRTTLPPATGALLTGCVVNSSNVVTSCSHAYPPSGWTQVDAQGFETGALQGFEQFAGNANFGTGHPHTGTHDMEGTVDFTSTNIAMFETAGFISTWREIYISFWEFVNSNARFNDEWDPVFLNSRLATDPTGTYQQIIPVNFEDDISFAFNATSTSKGLEIQGTTGLAPDTTYRYIPSLSYPIATWTQWEIHVKPNTPGQSDGVYELWKNGVNIVEDTGENTNGTWDFTASGHTLDIQVGGLYSKLDYTSNASLMKPAGTCDPAAGCRCGLFIGDGLAVAWNGGYDDPAALTTLGNCGPVPPTWTAYFDDIVIIKK